VTTFHDRLLAQKQEATRAEDRADREGEVGEADIKVAEAESEATARQAETGKKVSTSFAQ
jgi:hypothetical protein